jgi:FkbM family methyltransferase
MVTLKRILRKAYSLTRDLSTSLKMKILRIQYYPPNYVYFDNFNQSSVIIDAGCGHEAELSKHLIQKHKLKAFGVDPTKKHAPYLKILEDITKGKFRHLPLAVTPKSGFITFHESQQNESGSILADHTNILNDDITTYTVESVNLRELLRRIGANPVDFIKLDLEGAEYDLLNDISEEDVNPFKQIFIEFHHHCTAHTIKETMLAVKNICSKGFKAFTRDRHNYLFYK